MVKELFEMMPTIYGREDEVEMLPIMKENGIKLIIYGAGNGGKFLVAWIKHIYKIVPDLIVDRQPMVDYIDEIPVISCDEFKKSKVKEKFIVMITIAQYYEDKGINDEINEVIKEAGKDTEYIICRVDNVLAPYNLMRYHYIKEYAELFERTYGWLADDVSKETMEFYLRTIVLGEKYSGITIPEQYKYWGMESEKEAFFKLSEEEVLLNVGAAMGDTVYQYLKCRNPYKKIIAVEASKEVYEKLKRNLGFLDNDVLEKIQADNYFLGRDGKTIDNLYSDEDISLINMDIEGAELSVLKTAVNIIRKNRPVLSICVYHKMEDLVEIPTWIRGNVDDYIFILRKYPSRWGVNRWNALDNIELVLYAIPKERANLHL